MSEPFQHLAARSFAAQASLALERLDADRLEEMARSCEEMNRTLSLEALERPATLKPKFGNPGNPGLEMEVFARVIEATHSNLKVVRRVSRVSLQSGYGPERF
jgi:hypothetical protein